MASGGVVCDCDGSKGVGEVEIRMEWEWRLQVDRGECKWEIRFVKPIEQNGEEDELRGIKF